MTKIGIKDLKPSAPMLVDNRKIVKKSMKLYTYLVCISGLASFPEHTRMFRQKDLFLTEIKRCTGITDKTVKLYMWYLEDNHLIHYIGDSNVEIDQSNEETRTQHIPCHQEQNESREAYMKRLHKLAEETWKHRNKLEKRGVYHISRPEPWTPVPEETLDILNIDFKISETCLKIYLFCCRYRDLCVEQNRNFKVLTFEELRDILGLKQDAKTNSNLRSCLIFLKGVGLIDFDEGVYINRKGAEVPSFKIKEVYYYISYSIDKLKWKEGDKETPQIIEQLKQLSLEAEKRKEQA